MAESEESLHSKIDDHADAQLSELKARVVQARAQVDRAGGAIAGKLQPDGPAAMPPATQPPIPAEPVPRVGSAPAPDAVTFADQLAKRVPQTPVVHDPSDFGDIAANLATDDDWKNG